MALGTPAWTNPRVEYRSPESHRLWGAGRPRVRRPVSSRPHAFYTACDPARRGAKRPLFRATGPEKAGGPARRCRWHPCAEARRLSRGHRRKRRIGPGVESLCTRGWPGPPMTYVDAVPQAEILERLCEADVVVQPSEHEEFGSAIAEALACGIPVVTGPTNGTSEYTPTTGSVTFDRYEPHSLAHAIDRALSIYAREPCARSVALRASLFRRPRGRNCSTLFVKRRRDVALCRVSRGSE